MTYEGGGAAQHGAIQTRTVAGPALDVDAYLAQLRTPGWGPLPTSAIAVEQTHNRGGGRVHPFEPARGAATAYPAGLRPALRRGPDLERVGRHRRPAARVRGAVRHPLGLLVQRTRRARGLAGRDVGGARRAGPRHPAPAGWRHAPGRHPGRGRGATRSIITSSGWPTTTLTPGCSPRRAGSTRNRSIRTLS